MFSRPITAFRINANAVDSAPQMTPIAEIDEPVTLLISFTTRMIAAMTASIAMTIHVIGQARSAPFIKNCAAAANFVTT